MRRAQVEFLEWIPRLILMVVAIVIVVIIVRYFTDREIDDAEVREAAITYRLLMREIAPVQDGRAYPGVIDMARFTTRDDPSEFGPAAARLTLFNSPCGHGGKEMYLDETTFKRYYAFGVRQVIGRGSADFSIRNFSVTTLDGTSRCPAILQIEGVYPNS